MQHTRKPGRALLAPALVLTLTLAAGCRASLPETRFDAWDARVAALIELASTAKVQCAERAPESQRDERVGAWDELLRALVLARAAGANAYLAGSPEGLARIEREVDLLLAHLPPIAESEPIAAGD